MRKSIAIMFVALLGLALLSAPEACATESDNAPGAAGYTIITDLEIDAETLELDKYIAAVESKAASLNCYLESKEIKGGSYYYTTMLREASLHFLVPDGAMEAFSDALYELGGITYSILSLRDSKPSDTGTAMNFVMLEVKEVESFTPKQPIGFWAKTWANFKENLFSVGRGLRDFASGFLSAIPYLVLIAVPVAVALVLILRRRRRRKSKK